MSPSRASESELAALRAELERASAQRAQPAPPPEPAQTEPPAGDLERQMEEVRRALAQHLEDAETLAADHPLLIAGAAFLLGFGVARLLRRG